MALFRKRLSIENQANESIGGDVKGDQNKQDAEPADEIKQSAQAAGEEIESKENEEAKPEGVDTEQVDAVEVDQKDVNQEAAEVDQPKVESTAEESGLTEAKPVEVDEKEVERTTEENSLTEVKAEPNGSECTNKTVDNQEASSESKEADLQPNGVDDAEVAEDIETMRVNIVEAIKDFQTRIDEAKGIKLNLENLLKNLSGVKCIEELDQSIQNDLLAGEFGGRRFCPF